jgi:nucleotide-binding universal stress UspA family protein
VTGQRILVAHDDSPRACRALAAAVDLAKLTGGALTAVAIEAHLPHYGATVGEVTEELAVEEQACRRWMHAATAYAAEHGLDLATDIRAGHPAPQLLRAAEEHHADLLILGHPAHSTLRSRIIGNTADHLIERRAPCPVLIIP